ncbi:MAG TPA: DUF4012 domain-containing protein [Acidimicrobiia bacterium]|jgi:hypothetical protein
MSEPEAPPTPSETPAAPQRPAARRARPHRRRNRLIVLGVIVVVVLWCAFAAFQMVQARRHAQLGLDQLDAAQQDLGPAQLIRGEGLGRMKAAQAEFDQAASAGDSFVLKPFEVVPFVGRQVKSVDALTGAAAKVVRVGVGAMEQSTQQLNKPTTAGPDRVALVRQLGVIAADARRQLRGLDLGPRQALLGPLSDARAKFGRKLGKVRTSMVDVDDASVGVAEMAQGPTKYLVLAANNSEMRAGSGMLLSAGVMNMGNGQFDLGPMTDTGDLMVPAGAVPVSGDLAARWGWTDPSQEWRNLAMTPRFADNAALAAQMWKAKTGEAVDGVIAIDPIGLKALIEVSGPVTVGGKIITRDNIVQETLLQSYLDYGPATGNLQRRERSSDIARAIVDQLDAKGWDVATLVDDLQHAAQGRHVLAWSSKPEQQRGWEAAGVSGRLRPDSMLLAVQNRAGNKLDQFLHISAAFEHSPVSTGSQVTVHIHIENQAPTTGLNTIVDGPYSPEFVAGEYSGILSVNIPGVSRAIHLDGGGEIVAAGPDGPTRVVGTEIQVFRGEKKDYTLTFQVPSGYEHVTIEPSARYPAVTWTANGQTWEDDSARTIRW